MIRDLSISNLGVIAATHLEFERGLTVLTGETGAGKTLVTTALNLLLGAKPDPAMVRHGATEAIVDCTLVLEVPDPLLVDQLAELGAVVDDGELVVSRLVGSRSRAILGSRPVAAAVLADLMGERVTVHGQHGQVRLTRAADQRALLDSTDHRIEELLPVVRQAWANLRDAQGQLESARQSSAQDARILEELRALVEDVTRVAPDAHEDAALDARIALLAAREAVERSARTALAMLADGDSIDTTDATTLLAQARRLLEPHAAEASFAGWIRELESARESLQAVAHGMSAFLDDLESDETSVDALMARRGQIGALMRHWGADLSSLLERADAAARQLALAADPAAHVEQLQRLVTQCETELEAGCAQLHALRADAGERMATAVETELQELGLVHARFSVVVERQGNPASHGDDAVEFCFSANPGLPPQPLALVGSGGELSRVMLALESVAPVGAGHTFVFDEIDAGIGGRAALEVARRLRDLATEHQVIVVTHLAQVAAFADHHIVVEKQVVGSSTETTARALADEERPHELTRLLSGVEGSAAATAHAIELLELAARSRGGAD